MTRRILAESDRDRLRSALYGKTLVEVGALFPDVSPDTAARAAAGMPITPASRRVILERLGELARIEGGAS